MRFNKDTDSRISDLEKQVDDLRRLLSARKYGNQGGNPIGWRVPWVRYKFEATEDPLNSDEYFLEPTLVESEIWGSETDTLIHRMYDDDPTWANRGVHLIGRGTWLMWFWVNFQYNPLETSYPSYNRHAVRFNPRYSSTYVTPLGRPELHSHVIWSQPFTGVGGTFSETMTFLWPFNVKGAVTPAAPSSLLFRMRSNNFTYKNSTATTSRKAPDDVFAMFVRLDSEALRQIEFLMPGDGVEEVIEEPPPP